MTNSLNLLTLRHIVSRGYWTCKRNRKNCFFQSSL